jgi:serine/threonine-protein kinase
VNEAKIARMLKSPNAGKVLDVGVLQPQNTPYIVMEFLDGRDLAKVSVEQGPMSLTTAVDYMMQACVALTEAHILGIIHRDIKPANMFLTFGYDGQPCIKVLDFGIAKLTTTSEVEMTRTRATLGSALYSSPEQLQSAKDVDARTDIWSLGICFFQLVTRQYPFTGNDIALLAVQIVTAAPKKLRAIRPELPQAFDAIMDRWLAKNVEKRFSSVAELATVLAPFGSSLSESAMRAILAIQSRPRPELDLEEIESDNESVESHSFPEANVNISEVSAPIISIGERSAASSVMSAEHFVARPRRPIAAYVGIGAAIVAAIVITAIALRTMASSTALSQSAASIRPSVVVVADPSPPTPQKHTQTTADPVTHSVAASAPAAPKDLATLNVTTTGPATCDVNGVARGSTPFALSLPEGDYSVVCHAAGGATAARSIRLDSGRSETVNLAVGTALGPPPAVPPLPATPALVPTAPRVAPPPPASPKKPVCDPTIDVCK